MHTYKCMQSSPSPVPENLFSQQHHEDIRWRFRHTHKDMHTYKCVQASPSPVPEDLFSQQQLQDHTFDDDSDTLLSGRKRKLTIVRTDGSKQTRWVLFVSVCVYIHMFNWRKLTIVRTDGSKQTRCVLYMSIPYVYLCLFVCVCVLYIYMYIYITIYIHIYIYIYISQ